MTRKAGESSPTPAARARLSRSSKPGPVDRKGAVLSTQNPSNKRAFYEDRAEELFQAGKVDTGFEQLELAWRRVPFTDSHEVLGYTNRHLRIAAAYAHLKAGRECLSAAENTLNGLKAKGQAAPEDNFLLAILHSRFDHIWPPKRSLEFF